MSSHRSQRVNNLDALFDREKVTRFTLAAQEEKFVYRPEKKLVSFYQFCRMHNPKRSTSTQKIHEMRKIVYDEEHTIVKSTEALISAPKLKKFIKSTPAHKFTLYETFDIKLIDTPSDLEVYTACSAILNGDSFLAGYDNDKPIDSISNVDEGVFYKMPTKEFDFF